jgi:hypothetical protein
VFDEILFSKYEVVGQRQDDLPCYVCGDYADIIILRVGDRTYDVCDNCAKKLGIEW